VIEPEVVEPEVIEPEVIEPEVIEPDEADAPTVEEPAFTFGDPPTPPTPKPTPQPAKTAAALPADSVAQTLTLGNAPVEEPVFSLDADDHQPAAMKPADALSLSGATAAPAARQTAGGKAAATAPAPATNGATHSVLMPAEGRRPAVRITLVKPGEKSPFGK
jgi:hypothetical protein